MNPLILTRGQSIEKVTLKNIELSLLSSGQGTEVIHHRLSKGNDWSLIPEAGWDGMEFIYILTGVLRKHDRVQDLLLYPGDNMFFHPVQEHTLFTADSEVEFIYVTSRPVFHLYSLDTKELMDLAVKTELKDGYSESHCSRIRKLSILIGRAMNLSSEQLYNLEYGAFFHDIGKMRIPENILQKQETLSTEEWQILKQHAEYGAEILKNTGIPSLIQAATIVEQHHERHDGSGYPEDLTGQEILIEAAIVAVVDSFDAMCVDRPYHKRRTEQDAVEEIIHHRGTLYHPVVVDTLLEVLATSQFEDD